MIFSRYGERNGKEADRQGRGHRAGDPGREGCYRPHPGECRFGSPCKPERLVCQGIER